MALLHRTGFARALGRRARVTAWSTLAAQPALANPVRHESGRLFGTPASSWAAAQPSGHALGQSREREVKSVCNALVDSIEAGDQAWFERLIVQLRGILLERQNEAAAGSAGEYRPTSSFPTRDTNHTNIPEIPDPPSHAANQGSWTQRQRATQSSSFPTVGKVQQAQHQAKSSWTQRQRSAQSSDTAPFPTAEATRSQRHATNSLPPEPQEEDPPWLQTLILLERAAAQTSTPHRSESMKATNSTTPAIGYFPARTEVPADEEAIDDVKLDAYLSSFASKKAAQAEEEPEWARVIRLLEALPVVREKRTDFDRAKGLVNEPAKPQLKNEGTVDNSRKSVRMRAYNAMLEDAERAAQAAPGASLPVRFNSLNPPPRRKPSAPPPKEQPHTPDPPPKAPLAPAPTAAPVEVKPPKKSGAASLDDPVSQAVGRGNLVSSRPVITRDEPLEDVPLRKEDFVWSEHEFNDGEEENKKVLKQFTKEFKRMAKDTPEGLRNARLLTAALDLALACVKCYELDKADAIYRRAIGECRIRGMPWDVKCIQDMATLRCKQHRQADAAELLEELAAKAPPHPATFINLGTVYNQLRQYEKAESWFLQAVNLKGGTPDRDDVWNLGICKKNMGKYDEALPMLEQALAEFQEHEPHHPVTIAKLHSSVGGCLHDMGRYGDAVDQYQQAHELYTKTVGTSSPLFCGAAEGLAKALQKERRFQESFDALLESFEVHAKGDAVHPTPLFEGLEMALAIHEQDSQVPLTRFAPLIEAGIENLESRGQAEDGNAGLVMIRGGKVLSSSRDPDLGDKAIALIERGKALVQKSNDQGEADLSYELLQADMLLQTLRSDVTRSVPPGSSTPAGQAREGNEMRP
eukprot:TRINITY_DN58105_c0_g1_i1.p1 TRINITY_DN58105_c0_g1~~TRINITY_DN58105_c0_g1_i1.p1  ORF type:complete len:863 (-),score=148.07 TRINITY_DN58105_c0_g1_i1:16-2604(-)